MSIVWRGKIIRTAACCVVYNDKRRSHAVWCRTVVYNDKRRSMNSSEVGGVARVRFRLVSVYVA